MTGALPVDRFSAGIIPMGGATTEGASLEPSISPGLTA